VQDDDFQARKMLYYFRENAREVRRHGAAIEYDLGLGHCVHMATSPLVPPALKLSNCESKKKVGLGFLQQNYFIVESE
jgi:hypothetical protein